MSRGAAAAGSGIVALALGGLLALGVATPSAAHSVIVDSTPTAGETLTELPAEFGVTANETLLDVADGAGFAIQVRDEAGLYYGTGCLSIVDASMTTPAALGAAGEYTMVYQLVSADGHTLGGEIPFRWEPPAGFEPEEGSAAAPACGNGPAPNPGPGVSEDPSSMPLTEAIWIGAAVLAVGIAVAIAIVVTTRRKG